MREHRRLSRAGSPEIAGAVTLGAVFLAVTVACVWMSIGASAVLADNPKEHVDWWRNNYEELAPGADPRVARAQDIFDRVLRVADKRPGVEPQLLIIATDALGIKLPICLPDSWIIVSRGVLDICYKDSRFGDDRLAFVLGHEIAHAVKDDFWHYRFFEAREHYLSGAADTTGDVAKTFEAASYTDDVLEKELQADEYGIIYASTAGFRTDAIVNEDTGVNFFEEWVSAMHPDRIRGLATDKTYLNERALTVRARLKQVVDNIEFFNLGVLFYQAGRYGQSLDAFQAFVRLYPSREVYHNVGCCYHQLALEAYEDTTGTTTAGKFKLSIAIDPHTRAESIRVTRGGGGSDFKRSIKKSIDHYKKASEMDPSYVLAYSNCACALMARAEEGDIHSAIGMLYTAIKTDAQFKEAYNNLGVAYASIGDWEKAEQYLAKASEMDSTYDAPLFNLGRMALDRGLKDEATRYWASYLLLDPVGRWAAVARELLSLPQSEVTRLASQEQPREALHGMPAGALKDQIPKEWGKPTRVQTVGLNGTDVEVWDYDEAGITLVCEGAAAVIVAADETCRDKTSRGISVGASREDLITAYGHPSRSFSTSQGECLAYDSQRIVFKIHAGRVLSWLFYSRG